MDIKDFFVALMGDWVVLMSGVASVVLAVVGIAKKWEKVPRWAFWLAAIVCFFLASARVWTTEHKTALQLQSQLDELKNPNLSCSIEQVSDTHNLDTAVVALVVTVRNTGAPSVAEQYELSVQTASGQVVGQPLTIPPVLHLTYPNRVIDVNTAMDLHHKTINPIPHNALKRGYLLFAIPGISSARIDALSLAYEIVFRDINGKQSKCSRAATDQTGPGNTADFAGVDEN